MEATLILVKEYCTKCNVEQEFVQLLQDEGLLEVKVVEEEWYIDKEQLEDLEQYRRWHYDLHINVEGIDAMKHLIKKVRSMHQEINRLKNRLRLHEEGW